MCPHQLPPEETSSNGHQISMTVTISRFYTKSAITTSRTFFNAKNLSYLLSFDYIFLNDLKNIKQTLINNGFPNYIVDTKIKQFIDKTEQRNIDNTLNHKQSMNLYYKNQFHSNHKIDEHILKNLTPQKCLFYRSYLKNKTYHLLQHI